MHQIIKEFIYNSLESVEKISANTRDSFFGVLSYEKFAKLIERLYYGNGQKYLMDELNPNIFRDRVNVDYNRKDSY
jgi:hypothetical protein